ncbi:MAG: hypothetical protein IKQ09_05215 [Bacteroidales bacterium]|nr:hypothetical protein [Bacteroidales bacterium]
MRNNKLSIIIIIIGVLINVNGIAQSKYSGFVPDSTSYYFISLPTTMTKDAILVDNDISNFPFLLIDDNMLLLSNDNIDNPIAFSLPDKMHGSEDVFIIDTIIISKVSDTIKKYDGYNVSNIMIMPDDNYDIYPANYGYIYFIKHDADSSSVMLMEMNTGKYVTLFTTPFHIENIVGDGLECYITSGVIVFYVTEKDFIPIAIGDTDIQSIVSYEDGVFYSTQKACYYIGSKGLSYPFLLGDIKQLMLVDNRLYFLFRDGLLSVIDNADSYHKLLEKAINEQKIGKDDK